jgi:hypothetical protein
MRDASQQNHENASQSNRGIADGAAPKCRFKLQDSEKGHRWWSFSLNQTGSIRFQAMIVILL